ncbi:hypothetical protein KAH27_03805 [bacterium]|nr:hypothetical protein [bacterium]
MKILFKLFAISVIILLNSTNIFSEIIWADDFNVTAGGGDVNYQAGDGRQSGYLAPIFYNWYEPAGTPVVTNEGPNAGQLFIPSTYPADLPVGPNHNFTESGNLCIETELIRIQDTEWAAFLIGKDGIPAQIWAGPGIGILSYPNGNYFIWDHNKVTGGFYYAELDSSSNSALKVKMVMSQPSGFPPAGDTKVALFINDRPYPVVKSLDPGFGVKAKYLHTYSGGFANNFTGYQVLGKNGVADCGINAANFIVSIPPDTTIKTSPWTGVSDSGITNSKFYTHAVNFNYDSAVIINGVTFERAPSNTAKGLNWEFSTDANVPPTPQNGWGPAPNLDPECTALMTNFLYDAYTCGSITLSDLDPELEYIISLYGIGFESPTRGRPSYFITSDGNIFDPVDQDEFGQGNGQILTYQYKPSSDGIFSISTKSSYQSNWIFYAFSNEIALPGKPENLIVSQGIYADKIRASWSAENATTFSIYRATTNIFSLSTELSSTIITNLYEDFSVNNTDIYYYWVKACNTGGCSDLTGPVEGFTQSANPPDKPEAVSPDPLNTVTSPVTFVATLFSDPGGYLFKASQWQISSTVDFSSVEWNSGDVLPQNYFTIPRNAVPAGTNFWRTRFQNSKNTWSEWSDASQFIFINGEKQTSEFLDKFCVPGSGDVNTDYNIAGRQFGNSAPLTYKTSGVTELGSELIYPGELKLYRNSGCSPNGNFINSGYFKIEFDAIPHIFDNTTNWLSLSFGKDDQSTFSPASSSGLGTLFSANGLFGLYDGSSLISIANGVPTSNKFHVLISVSTPGFDEGDPVSCAIFVNGIPMTIDSDFNKYMYTTFSQFINNYITLFNSGDDNPSYIDNLSVKKTHQAVTVHSWTGDSDSLIENTKTYTHLINFNDDDIVINGQVFLGTGVLTNQDNGFPNGAPEITKTNWIAMSSDKWISYFPEAALSNLNGGSGDLGHRSIIGVGSASLQLLGLAPYSSNTLYIFSQAHGEDVPTIFAGGDGGIITNVEAAMYGIGSGMIIQYDYIASKDGTFVITATPEIELQRLFISGIANEQTGVSDPLLSVDSTINFGDVVISDSKNLSLQIANAGGGIVDGLISGANSYFSISTNAYYVEAGKDTSVSVTFMPTENIAYTNTITLAGSGGTNNIIITGTGVPEPFLFIIYQLLFIIYWRKFIYNK